MPLAGYAAADVVRQPWEMTASERARLAADRVPSPPRDAPKPRRKSVRWVLDEELVRSRWFLKVRANLRCTDGTRAAWCCRQAAAYTSERRFMEWCEHGGDMLDR